MTQHSIPDPMLTTAQASAFLGVADNTLRIARIRGNGPSYQKFGRSVRYSMSDLLDYVQKSKRQNTSQVKFVPDTDEH